MTTWLRFVGPLLLVVGAVATLSLVWWYRLRLTPHWLHEQIVQKLPPGSTPAQVTAFLDMHHIDHGEPEFDEVGTSALPRGPALFLRAAVKGFRKGDLLSDGVFLRFRFDTLAGLTDFAVFYSYTCL